MIRVKNNYKGLFYPDDISELREMLRSYLGKVPKDKKIKGKIKALIVPHAGYIYSGPVAAYSYAQLKEEEVDKVLLIGPSHNVLLRGLAATKAPYWESPFEVGSIRLEGVSEGEYIHIEDEPFLQEHSLETQIPFILKVLPNAILTPLIAGDVDDFKKAAHEVGAHLDDRSVLIISSDLSHYHSYDQAISLDKQTIKQILALEPVLVPDQACGFVGINIAIELAKARKWKPMLLDYRNSGDTAGNRSQVVGYCALAFYN